MDTVRSSLEIELPARVSVRGVLAGMLVGLALATTMMALGNAVGAAALPRAGSQRAASLELAGWFLLSFVVGAFAGGWVAAGAARALRRRDGVLHGLVTWAAIALVSLSLVGGVMHGVAVGVLSGGPLGGEPGDRPQAMLLRRRGAEIGAWGTFATLLVPLLAAVGGGVVGASRERRAAGLVARATSAKDRRAAPQTGSSSTLCPE
ncbi:MAG: hypothetical protein ACXVAN_07080 [Polyangia bacterium]